jgi:hypothetical protein
MSATRIVNKLFKEFFKQCWLSLTAASERGSNPKVCPACHFGLVSS